MANINQFLRDNLTSVSKKNMQVAPGIDEKKINNAVKSFCYSGSPGSIIALFDNTLFGSGKDGLLFTGEQLIYRASFSEPITINYVDISSVEHVEISPAGKKDKIIHSVEILLKEREKITIKDLLECDYAELARVINQAITDFDEYVEEQQLISIDEMDEEVKLAYMKVIINMAIENDNVIDDKEFAEILLLMTRLDLDSESRFSLRAYMTSAEQKTPLSELMEIINNKCPEGQVKSLHISLAKDLINLWFNTGGEVLANFTFLQENRHLIIVSDAEIDLVVMAIRNDQNMLKDDVSDDQIKTALKELSAKAAAVGTPLAAVYLSGSVIGMSAAGMTSGLATLGFGGMLGLSSMATGIGVAVLIGVGAYAGMRKLTGANELTRFKRRELMLNEVIKQTQTTISLLIQNINYISQKLNGLLSSQGVQDAQIKRLMALMGQMTGAGSVLTGKSNSAQSSVSKLRCARFLDERKLHSLTREATKSELFTFIRDHYEERHFTQKKDDKDEDVIKLVVKNGLSNKEIENLANAFEAVGYFNMGDVLKGTAADVAGKAKDKLTGLFS